MNDTPRMPVYCMAGHKFRLQLPSTYINKPIIDLKIYIQHERGFPTECQLVFICMDGKNFKALNDEELVPNLAKEGSTNTLHVYMKSASQTPSLVKTRQSDFDEWLKKLRELNISPHYDARPPAAAPDASTIHQSASNPLPLSQLLHTPARQLSAPQAAPRNIGAQRSAAFPTVLEDREDVQGSRGCSSRHR
ncbi:hypothetical protein EB796_013107 [Bugula neritina]|uniref:Uncharacterized protein n=1 Tax=Bugula neritina TaxID=10212 RepID=A0A7J7JT66_BUGNE|nr:hypothetical protein EB796_013107 [Bugula neritina]